MGQSKKQEKRQGINVSNKKLEKRGFRIVVWVAGIAIVVLILATIVMRYLTQFYAAETKALTASFAAEETDDYYLFDGDAEDKQAIIFYPGGKVDEVAYASLCLEVSELGYDVYLCRMPYHLAVFSPSLAEEIIEANPQVESWSMMGHSLGGAMAGNFVSKHPEDIDELVLLGAYCANDISNTDVKVLLMYGSNDQVMKRDKYEENRKNLPDEYVEYVIEGGNHGGFGFYGHQEGDGQADIRGEEQQQEVVDQIQNLQK